MVTTAAKRQAWKIIVLDLNYNEQLYDDEKNESENEAETTEEPDFEACCENIENTQNIAVAEKAAVAEANTADAAQNTAEN